LFLDYHLKDPQERLELVRGICDENVRARHRDPEGVAPLDARQLKYMADYLLFVADSKQTGKEKREERPIVTRNRDVTVSKRQTSFEEVAESLRGGEDALHMMIMPHNDYPLDVKDEITEEDLDRVPSMRANMEVINSLKRQLEHAEGKRRYALKSQIISKYQEMYTAKSSFEGRGTRPRIHSQIASMVFTQIPEHITVGEDGYPRTDAWLSLLVPEHVCFLLKYYQMLKQDSWEALDSDMRWMLIDLEDLVTRTLLPDFEMLYDLIVWRVDGLRGSEIVRRVERDYGVTHSEQYFSTLLNKTIPKMVAEQAQKEWLVRHYLYEDPEHGHWKICRCCGKVKLAHPFFFHRNTGKDGFYSKCKECRSIRKYDHMRRLRGVENAE